MSGPAGGDGGPGYATRARVETLFDTAAPGLDPEGLVTRYLDFEVRRCRMDGDLAVDGDLAERLRAVHWYLADYGARRGGGLPLSAGQLAFLNAPMPLLGLGRTVSVAAYSFIANEKPAWRDLSDDMVLREALFWWALERAPRLAPGGELVTAAQVRALTHTEARDVGTRFALNDVTRKIRDADAGLDVLDLRSTLDRAVLVATLMIRCIAEPVLARFLPQNAVADLLAVPAPGKPPLLADLLDAAFGPAEGATVRDLLAALAERFGRHGLLAGSAASPAGPGGPPNAGPCFVRDPKLRSGLERGIAVIGPARAQSGLGHALRRSVEVLAHAGRTPAVLEFGLDNPAPNGPAVGTRPRAPRAINLLHLNADTIPLAHAYLDRRLFERSYTIGYVFWELDQVPACHRLALDLVDEIWVASDYNRDTYARVAPVPVHAVGLAVAGLPEPAPVSRRDFGLDEGAFTFLATFDSFSYVERKNPHGVVEAFRTAFPVEANEPVALVLKTHNRTRVGDPHQLRVWQAIDRAAALDPRIRVIDRTLDYRDLIDLKRLCNAYVSLHRSEGLGIGMMEAMQLGLPVVATAYSGNMEFCAPDTAFLVDYDLVPVMPTEYAFAERGSRWAAPSTASAAAALRTVFHHPDRAADRARAGRRRIEEGFSTAAIAARYAARLDAVESILARCRG